MVGEAVTLTRWLIKLGPSYYAGPIRCRDATRPMWHPKQAHAVRYKGFAAARRRARELGGRVVRVVRVLVVAKRRAA